MRRKPTTRKIWTRQSIKVGEMANTLAISNSGYTTHTIGTSVTTVNGRLSPYNTIKPGDFIVLTAGSRVPINFKNLAGTAARPITIVNASDGQVTINNTSSWYGFYFQNCQYFRFTGTGSNYDYGIRIIKSYSNGILFQNKTDNFEFDHIEINEVSTASAYSIAIQGQTVTTSVADYDYDGDGDMDSNDIVTRANYTQHNFHIHHMLIAPPSSPNKIMGMYIGNANWCDGDPVGTMHPEVHGCWVHDNIITGIDNKAIKVGSVRENCYIYNNYIEDSVLTFSNSTIELNPGCTNAQVYNNKIIDCIGVGICHRGEGATIKNNLLVRPGRTGTVYDAGINLNYPGGYSHSNSTYILNNTIIDPAGNGVEDASGFGSNDRCQNNIIVNPGAGHSYTSLTSYTTSYNYTTMTIGDVVFNDAANDDYTLTASSPAVDAGLDVSAYGVTDDIDGIARPQRTGYDEGAHELV